VKKAAHHIITEDYTLTHQIRNSVATVYFYDTIVVVEVAEGQTLSIINGAKLLLKTVLHLKTKPWVYISNRVNSYAVVPTDYDHLDRISSLKALSIVMPESKSTIPLLEPMFCRKPFKQFVDLQSAMDWAKKKLELETIE